MIDLCLIQTKLVPDLLKFDNNHCDGALSLYLKNQKFKNLDLKTFRPRIPNELLVIYGGFENGYPSSTIKTFDIRSKRWFQFRLNNNKFNELSDDDYSRVYHQTVNLGSKLYIIGGSNGFKCLNTIICLDLSEESFIKCSSMHELRSFHCSVTYENRYIIVCGGYDGQKRLRTVEIYDSKNDQWSYLPSMQTIRSDASALLVNNCIYVAGGVGDLYTLNSMEFYSFITNQWTIISFMHIQRRCFSFINIDDYFYAIGGCTDIYEFNCLKSVERYNLKTNQWQFIQSLPKHRMCTSCAVLDQTLYVFGGYDGFTSYRTIFGYNFKELKWAQIETLMPIHLSGTTTNVILDQSSKINLIKYSYYGNMNHISIKQPLNYNRLNTFFLKMFTTKYDNNTSNNNGDYYKKNFMKSRSKFLKYLRLQFEKYPT